MLKPRKLNEAAVLLGKRGAKVRLAKQTPEKRSEVARIAARARWSGKKGKQ